MNTPPMMPPDQMPPIRTPHDLYQRWCALMGRLGFSERLLWLTFLDSEGHMTPAIQQIENIPDELDRAGADHVMTVCRHVLDAFGEGASVAILVSRPGNAEMTTADRTWARELTDAATRAGVPAHPIHLATDEAIRVFAADDLLADAT